MSNLGMHDSLALSLLSRNAPIHLSLLQRLPIRTLLAERPRGITLIHRLASTSVRSGSCLGDLENLDSDLGK